MRIFKTAVEARQEILRDLVEMGVVVHNFSYQDKVVEGDPDYDTLEMIGYTYAITSFSPEIWLPLIECCGLSLDYISMEFRERTAAIPRNPGKAWEYRPDVWKEFIQRDGRFHYTYSERMVSAVDAHGERYLWRAIRELRERPGSRQAIVTIYDKHSDTWNWGGGGRVPCSMHYQFMIRGGRLHTIYSQRSCDFMEHFPYDMVLGMMLAAYVWVAVQENNGPEIRQGHFVHQFGSLHAFRKNMPEGVF